MANNKNMETVGSGRRLLPNAMVALLVAVGCTAAQAETAPPPPGDETIKVFFQDKCPRYVDRFDLPLNAGGGKKVEWEAWNLEGTSKETDRKFSVIFDPFAGKTISTNNGLAQSTPLHGDAPSGVFFKYTIVSDEDSTCAPLDPFIRIF